MRWGDYRADPITCSPREDGLSCRHGVKPPLTHMSHHCFRSMCLCAHSPDAQYGSYPIRAYFLIQMAEDLLIWEDCLGPQLNPGSHTRLLLGGLAAWPTVISPISDDSAFCCSPCNCRKFLLDHCIRLSTSQSKARYIANRLSTSL